MENQTIKPNQHFMPFRDVPQMRRHDLEQATMLHINNQLFKKGIINEEIYLKAKDEILRR